MAFGFLIAAAAKSAQFPFQTWLPDAMEAPTPVSALIHAATMVNAGVYLLARFYPAFAPVPGWKTAVIAVGVISALMTACMALVAPDLKRALAYSTVSQLGYMVYAVGTGDIFASQFHLFSHAVFKALLFLAAGAVIHAVGTRDMLKMGGLGAKMPFVRNVFVIGALSLAGLPILNGFWSKESVLEAGLTGGPFWALAMMLVGAGLTACYTFRMVWMVFYGEARSTLHAHDATAAMKLPLGLLAFGTLTTWLVAGPFGHLLESTLPFHKIHALSTGGLVAEIMEAPLTWGALAVIALGLLAWWGRERLTILTRGLGWLGEAASQSFGFEWLNRQVVCATQSVAQALRVTQPGHLSWNVVGIIGGLVAVLIILTWG
jgi:NADH-quinone oxidoreductase subunit L